MQKYANKDMQNNAKFCNEKYASNMQNYTEICKTMYAVICTYMLAINMQICALYMQLCALYVDIRDGKYMQKYANKYMHKFAQICKLYANYMHQPVNYGSYEKICKNMHKIYK